MNNQKFIDKFMAAFFLLAIIKIIGIFAQLFHQSFLSVLGTLVIFLVIAAIVFLVITALKDKESSGSGGSTRFGGNSSSVEMALFNKIRNKYEELAQKYIDEKNYHKAAKVYMNLLRDNYRAAKTLEDGGLYSDAALIYLKKLQNKTAAASCYEKGKEYKKAIDLYKEMGQNEKVGDLYKELSDIKNAHHHYQIVVDDYIKHHQIVKASLVYRKKMERPDEAQKILLKGWEENRDSFNCLNNYFANIFETKQLESEIKRLYQNTPSDKKLIYLDAMKHEFKKDEKLQEPVRNIAYEIIAEKINYGVDVVNDLKHFNPNDQEIIKDISRFRTHRNRILNS